MGVCNHSQTQRKFQMCSPGASQFNIPVPMTIIWQTMSEDNLRYLYTPVTSNVWNHVPESIRSEMCKYFIPGVEVRDLPLDHFLGKNGEQGLFAARKFFKYDILGEYTGIVVPREVCGHYVAALEDKPPVESLGVDAQKAGNELRYINSYINIDFGPNVVMKTCIVNKEPRILIICTTDILPGDEFLLDYGVFYNEAYILQSESKSTQTSSCSDPRALWAFLPMGESESDSESNGRDNELCR